MMKKNTVYDCNSVLYFVYKSPHVVSGEHSWLVLFAPAHSAPPCAGAGAEQCLSLLRTPSPSPLPPPPPTAQVTEQSDQADQEPQAPSTA